MPATPKLYRDFDSTPPSSADSRITCFILEVSSEWDPNSGEAATVTIKAGCDSVLYDEPLSFDEDLVSVPLDCPSSV